MNFTRSGVDEDTVHMRSVLRTFSIKATRAQGELRVTHRSRAACLRIINAPRTKAGGWILCPRELDDIADSPAATNALQETSGDQAPGGLPDTRNLQVAQWSEMIVVSSSAVRFLH